MKFLCRGHIRSGHQVESRDLTSKNVYARAIATVLNRIFSKFSELNKATSTYNLYISDFWYIYDLGSGQVPDFSIISQWGKYWNPSQRISKAQFFQNDVLLGHSWWPKVKCWSVTPLKSSEVTRGHQQFFADNLRLRRARDIKVVSMCLSRQYASTDMQLGSRRDLDLRSNFGLDLSRSCYMFRCVLTRQTRWCQNHCSIISNTYVIVEKLFRSKMPFLTFRDLWRFNSWS